MLRLRAYSQRTMPLNTYHGGTSAVPGEVSAIRPAVRGRLSGSLAEEFGDDPMSLVFRAAHSQAATVPSESVSNAGAGTGDEVARGAAVVAAFMGEIRRGFSSEEEDYGADVDTHARASGECAFGEGEKGPDRESAIPEASGSRTDGASEGVVGAGQSRSPSRECVSGGNPHYS